MESAFSPKERREMAALLGLGKDAERAGKWLDWLSYEIENSRRIQTLNEDYDEELRAGSVRKARGRPSRSIHAGDGAVRAAAVAYFKCTGHQPTNARSGRQRRLPPFFRLAQICTRLSDPGPFIAKLPRPFKGEGLEDFQPLPE